MNPMQMQASVFEASGFGVFEQVISETEIRELQHALKELDASDSVRCRGGIFAIRNLIEESAHVKALANSKAIRDLVEPILGQRFFPVRSILFDKIPQANWKVPWHQDLTIAVLERIEVSGYGPWSIKAGVVHVQPPASILEKMLTVRIHLDECSLQNGALRVLPGSHRYGRIQEAEIAMHRSTTEEHVRAVGRGGALLMRPLLLHASSPSTSPNHRRVIHLDFACTDLPGGLNWISL